MLKHIATSFLIIILFVACNSRGKEGSSEIHEDTIAKKMLQGVWLDDETEAPLMHVAGDTIYYADSQSVPVYFKIWKDTLYTYGVNGDDITRYLIDNQTENAFGFHSFSDLIVKLHKSEDLNDTLAFRRGTEIMPTYAEKTEKDSIVFYNGTRYRAYVYINPSKMKVVKTTYSEDGISMDNVYYDNIMHICIYEGRKSLYAQDITKQMFSSALPEEFLQQAILSDMNFTGINKSGYHYQALICIPESSVCRVINLNISFAGKINISAVK